MLLALLVGAGLILIAGQPAPAAPPTDPPGGGAAVGRPVHADTSPPLRDIKSSGFGQGRIIRHEHEPPDTPTGGAADPVVQSSTAGASATPNTTTSFEGVGQGFTGPQGGFVTQYAPPDTNGDVGPNNYVQIVNVGFAVFDKAGKVLYGPAPTNTVFKGFGGGCESNNDGDATVKYDRLANRWLISQFSVSTKPYLQCLAVSTSGDPTGSYHRFSYSMSYFPDYPKLGIWSDGYYTTFNLFNGNLFVGSQVCSYNRAALIANQPDTTQASQVCVTPSGGASVLPADLDGSTPPPAGRPDYLMSYGTNSLKLWKFDVNWSASPPTSTLSGPTSIPVSAFTSACGNGSCVPQLGTTQKLDSLADRLMYRLAYRNTAAGERLVVSHSVDPGNATSGIRWYEIRNPNGTPTVYQQGTYAPDSAYRWMSSAAMDAAGQIAIGYSVSSSSMNPAIRYAAHQSTDALGVMGSEATLIAGTGSQTTNLNRWGDYSSMAVDPSDDCTFWYTSEYLTSNGTWNWHTRIGTFKLPGCNTAPTPDFSVSLSPSSLTVNQGAPANYTATITSLNGYAGPVSLSSSPAGIAPAQVNLTSGSFATATLQIDTTGMTGTSTVGVTATDGVLSHSATSSLTVGTFSVTLTPTSQTVPAGTTANYNVKVTSLNGYVGTVNLGSTAGSLAAPSLAVPAGGSPSTTLSIQTSASSPPTTTFTVTGTDSVNPSLTASAPGSLSVGGADFTVSVSPASQSKNTGAPASYTITVTPSGGFSGTVQLSTSGGNCWITIGSPSPSSVTGSGTASFTATASKKGTYTITVTGSSGALNHSATATLRAT